MRPLKYKELLPEIAERSGHPQPVVETVLLKMFWPEVRHQLSTLKHPRLQILNLGTFMVNPKQLKTRMQRRTTLLGKIQGDNARSAAIRKDTEEEIALMQKISGQYAAEAERKRCVKEKKLCEKP